MINCDTQEEIDYYWEKLTDVGGPGRKWNMDGSPEERQSGGAVHEAS